MIKYKHIPTGDIFEKKILGVSPGEYYSYVCRCVQIHPYIVEQPKSKDWEKIEEPVKKPVLFTTEDGKEIREGDNWFAVTYSSNIVGRNYIDSTHDEKKHFSTLDSAKEYVIENKPIFTLQDMLAWGQFCSDNDSTHPCFYPKDLARERCGFIKK